MTVTKRATRIVGPKLTDLLQIDLNEPEVVLLHQVAYEWLYSVVVKLVDVFDFALTIVDFTI